ncbi:GNAT family N-acetyltransferase [Paenibacillus glufosinatiresistens]|uniref:GNAT family N-acetyltransferase n=1 Tax=Paenibacillus glufosinatiresistens TaxID=3070657 RepID=UPI00286E7980|nr:GNAT family protein [Paenibacillus sp. YX.27]
MDILTGTAPGLEGPRIVLRPLSTLDAEALLAVWTAEEASDWLGMPELSGAGSAEALIWLLLDMEREGDGLRWSLTLRDSGRVIGSAGFNAWQDSGARRGEIGCELHPGFWGHGYMTEALRLVLEFGFRKLRLNRIEAQCLRGNERSERLFNRLGFRKEGLLREYRLTRRGLRDVELYALLRREWESASAERRS